MSVKRIVTNIHTTDIRKAGEFYADILGLEIIMDHGWISTYGNTNKMQVQISFASEGGSGTATPELSIEVDNVRAVYSKMNNAGFTIEYPLTQEPWGVMRFYVRDPFGRLVNILAHTGEDRL